MKQTSLKIILMLVGLLMGNEKMAAQEPEEKAVWSEPFELVFMEYENEGNESNSLSNTDFSPYNLFSKGACYISNVSKTMSDCKKTKENGIKLISEGNANSITITLNKPIYIEKLELNCRSGSTKNIKFDIKAKSNEASITTFQSLSYEYTGKSTLSESFIIKINSEGASTGYIKSIKIYPKMEKISIGEAEFATHIPTTGLDFTDSDVNAYVISEIDQNNKVVRLEKINRVQEGHHKVEEQEFFNAIIVHGSEGDHYVNAIPSGKIEAPKKRQNDLTFSLQPTIISNSSVDYYILAKIDGQVGFAAVTEGTIPDRKGYFTLPKSANIKEFKFAIDNEETSIDIPKVDNGHNSQSFNLSGQRVGDNYKGIIIRNGKKYLKR